MACGSDISNISGALTLILSYATPIWSTILPLLSISFTNHVMLRPSREAQIFFSPVMQRNPLLIMQDQKFLAYPNKHLNHRRNRDARAGPERMFRLTDYIARYSRLLDVCRYQEMLQHGQEMKFRDETGQQLVTMLSVLGVKGWNHWGGRRALELRFSISEKDFFPFVVGKKLNMKDS